ncbi:MAG TPA: protein kinase [Polyangiaceae bacterium]|nr:protein kinase [Polyangiaceae bacterium]
MAEDVFDIVGTTQGGAFRVDDVVAEGGFAVIYRAYHGAFRSNVALKCLKVPRALSEQEQKEFLESFREEAELLFRLSSATPSVVRPLQVGTLTMKDRRFVPFIALEWLEGRTLDTLVHERLREGQPPLGLKAAVKLLTPVADALYRAHRFPTPNGGFVSIVHRDLKPENIFIANVHGRETAKVLDFGIAKVKTVTTEMVGRQSAAQSNISAFTPAYGAPEQWLPKRFGQTGPWTDVYGLAMTLVEVLVGQSPMEGDHAAMMGSAIDTERRPTPRTEGVDVPDAAEAAFRRALAVDPKQRFHDISEFWNALATSVGLPGIAVDRGASVPPPAQDRTVLAPAAEVPDLVPSGRRPPQRGPASAPRHSPQGAPGAQTAPLQGPASRTPAEKDPNALFGHSFDFDDGGERGPRIELGTGRVRRDGIELDAPGTNRARMPSAAAFPVAAPAFVERPSRKMDLGGPLKLVGLAVLLMAGDWAYAAFTGEVLHFGPARMLWLAGPILALGVFQLFRGFVADGE